MPHAARRAPSPPRNTLRTSLGRDASPQRRTSMKPPSPQEPEPVASRDLHSDVVPVGSSQARRQEFGGTMVIPDGAPFPPFVASPEPPVPAAPPRVPPR